MSQKDTIKERRNSKLNCSGLKPSNSIYKAVKTNNQKFLKREKYTTPETCFVLSLELKRIEVKTGLVLVPARWYCKPSFWTHIYITDLMAVRDAFRYLSRLLRSSEDAQELYPLKRDAEARQGADHATTEPYSSPSLASMWKTTLNLVNYNEGAGFLALPYTI